MWDDDFEAPEYEKCDEHGERYDSNRYTSCYRCYVERRAEYAQCIWCGTWHRPDYPTCFQCRQIPGRDEAGDALRWLILWRDHSRCRACGSDRLPQVDHIVPCAKGGNAEEWNLQVLCAECNRGKGAMWFSGCRFEAVKTRLVRGYFLIAPTYFTPDQRQRFNIEVGLWRAVRTWDPLIQRQHGAGAGAA